MRKKENAEETLQPFAASTELECERQEYLTQLSDGFFLGGYISPRTGSTVVRVQVVGVCEVRTLAGMPGLVIVLDPACACR